MSDAGGDGGGSGSGRRRSMDLNLYLGLPRSPRRPFSLDLGSDLALGSVTASSPAALDPEAAAAADMPELEEPSDARTPCSPSRASSLVASRGPASEYQPAALEGLPYWPPPPSLSGTYSFEFSPSLLHPYDATSARAFSFDPEPLVHGRLSPPYVPRALDGDELPIGEDLEHVHYTPVSPQRLTDELVASGGVLHPSFSSSYVPIATPPVNELVFGTYQPIPLHPGDTFTRDGSSSSRQHILRNPEFRFRSLFESNRRVRARRFRSSIPYQNESPASGTSSVAAQCDAISERDVEAAGKNKASDDGTGKDVLEEGKEDTTGSAVSFECNICMDTAKEPVVTSCGHLFCWPCLYQWLHVYSDHKECPVCKGQVINHSYITPIYGRGNSEAAAVDRGDQTEDTGLKIPPRPSGRREESLRQRIQRPVSRRPGPDWYAEPLRNFSSEEFPFFSRLENLLDHHPAALSGRFVEGIPGIQGRTLDEEAAGRNRFGRQLDPAAQHILDSAQRRVLTRLRTRRMLREGNIEGLRMNPGRSGISREATPAPVNPSPLPQDGISPRYPYSDISATQRLAAAIHADISRLIGRFAGAGFHPVPGSSSADPQTPELPTAAGNARNPEVRAQHPLGATHSADQVSASSTMAVIQGDGGALDIFAEPNRAGSSRPSRRRGRNSSSGSLDNDGDLPHTRKSRRMN